MKGLTGYLSTLAALLFAVAVWVGHSSPQPDTELSSPIARSSYAFDFGQAQSVLCFSRPDETRQSDLKRIIYRLFETGGVAADNAGFKQLHVPVRVFTPERAEENAVSKLPMPQPPQGADPNLLYVFGLGEIII